MEVSTLNPTTTTESSRQLIGDDPMQSHQPKSQLIISTKTTINSQLINNSESSPSKSESVSLNHNNNHDVAKITSAKLDDEPIVTATAVVNASVDSQDLHLDVKFALRQLIDSIVSSIHNSPTATIAQSIDNVANNTLNSNGSENYHKKEACEDDLDDISEGKSKDMVILKNLSPSPQPVSDKIFPAELDKANGDNSLTGATTKRTSKRRLTETPDSINSELNQSIEGGGRSKRQRTQTKFFQLGDAPKTDRLSTSSTSVSVSKNTISAKKPIRASTGGKKSKTTATQEAKVSTAQESVIQYSNDLPDVICYEKNDFLAIRNEENTFYLCQLAENVRARRQFIKVKWLDTTDDGRTYFLTPQYDKVPQKSIIMPVNLNKVNSQKKGEQIFTLDDQARDNVMERLRRSLNASATSDNASSQEI